MFLQKNLFSRKGSWLIKKGKVLGKLLFSVSREVVFGLDLHIAPENLQLPEEFSLRWATRRDILAMDKKHHGYGRRGKRYSLRRLEKGDRCLIVEVHDRVVGYGWVMFEEMELGQIWHITLPKGKAYLYKEFVTSPFRGRGLNHLRRNFLLAYLWNKGCRTVYISTSGDNRSSIRSIRKSGFHKVGCYLKLRLFGFELPFVAPKLLNLLKSPVTPEPFSHTLLGKFRKICRREGLFVGLLKIGILFFRRVGVFGVDKKLIYELDLSHFTPFSMAKLSDVTYRWGTARDIADMDEARYGYSKRDKRHAFRRLEKGDRMLVGLLNGTIEGYLWIMAGAMELSETTHAPLSPLKAYIYRGFITKEQRGRHSLTPIMVKTLSILAQEGFQSVIICVYNPAFGKFLERKFGFKLKGKMYEFFFFHKRIPYISKETLKQLQRPIQRHGN